MNLVKSERVYSVVFPHCCAVSCEGWAASCVVLVRSGAATGLALHHSYLGQGFQHTPAPVRCHNKPRLRKLRFLPNNQEVPRLVVCVEEGRDKRCCASG